MKFSKLIKNKKGIVLETAVIFMVLIFTFCFVLSTATLVGYNRLRVENIKLDNDREAELMFEATVEKIVYDYLAYIEAIELKIPEPVTTAPPETQLSPESSGGIAQDTTKPNNEETIAPAEESTLADNREVVNVPVDIMPETPLLSPLSNTEEITAASTQPPVETTLAVTISPHLKFEDFHHYSGLICESEERLDNSGDFPNMLFTLKVYNEANYPVLEMQVWKFITRDGNGTFQKNIVQYINKYPQNNYQPEGN